MNDSLKQEQEHLRQELESRTQEVTVLNADLDTSKQSLLSHQAEITRLESENKATSRDLARLRQQLGDSQDREPVIQEQIQVSHNARKPVLVVSDQVRHKPGCTVTKDG